MPLSTEDAGTPLALVDWGRSLLYIFLITVPVVFSVRTTEAFEFPKLALLRGVAILLASGAGVALLGGSQRRGLSAACRKTLAEPTALGVLLTLLAAAASTTTSIGRGASWHGAEGSYFGLSTLAAFAVLFFAVRSLCADDASARTLLEGAAAGLGVSVGYGVLQLFGLDPLRWKAPVVFSGVARVFSTQGHPNSFAQLLVIGIPVLCYLLVASLRRRRFRAAFAYGVVAAAATALVALTLSRAAVLALAVGLGVLAGGAALARTAGRRLGLPVVLAGLVAVGLLLAVIPDEGSLGASAMWERLARLRNGGLIADDPRRFLWAAAWQMFAQHPVLGVGLDCFSLAYGAYRTPAAWSAEWGETPLKAHSQPLEILATCGVVGGAAALVVALGLVRAFVVSRRGDSAERLLDVAAFAGLMAFGVHNLFHFPTAAPTALATTLLALLSRRAGPARTEVASGEGKAWLRVAGVVLAAGLLYLFVLRPVRADVFCRAGTDALPGQPGLAVAYATESVHLDPSRALLWSRLAAADQAAAHLEAEPPARRRLLESGRAAAEQAIRLEPRNPYALANLGGLLSDLERESPPLARRVEVEQVFAQARDLDPNNTFVHVAAAAAALAAGDRDRASAWARRSLGLFPEFGPSRALLAAASLAAGRELAAAGDRDRARAAFQESVLLFREALASDWHGDTPAYAAAMRSRQEAMRALAGLH